MQEIERVGYRNRFLSLIGAPKESCPPRGVWPHALARVATLPDVIFELLRSRPNLVPSEDTDGKEAATVTGVPEHRRKVEVSNKARQYQFSLVLKSKQNFGRDRVLHCLPTEDDDRSTG
jgi:hypothetical protein